MNETIATASVWFMFACFFLALVMISVAWLFRD